MKTCCNANMFSWYSVNMKVVMHEWHFIVFSHSISNLWSIFIWLTVYICLSYACKHESMNTWKYSYMHTCKHAYLDLRFHDFVIFISMRLFELTDNIVKCLDIKLLKGLWIFIYICCYISFFIHNSLENMFAWLHGSLQTCNLVHK